MTRTTAELAAEAARVGAEVLLKYWQNLGRDDADEKARHDWVSRADRESEEAIIDFLRSESPGDDFLGEESGSTVDQRDTGRTWVIDPLDGTSNYLQHYPVWAVSIGLRVGADMVAGAVYEPLREEMFTAERGAGAFRNGTRIEVSSHPSLEGSFLATGFPFRAQKHVDTYLPIFRAMLTTTKGVRRAGSAALDLAYTAAGIFDGFFEIHLSPWDVAAGALLVQEAGGVVSDFSGGDLFWERGNIIGAPPPIHRDILAIIGQHTSEDALEK